MSRLNEIINDAEAERQRQKKECEIVVSERDILGTQVQIKQHATPWSISIRSPGYYYT